MVLRRYGGMLLALALLLAFALPLPAAEEKVVNLAHISFSGSLEEGAGFANPNMAAHHQTFKMMLERIKKAAKDDKIQGLYLQIENVQLGWGKLDELSRAIALVRKAGKKTFAYLESGDTKDYLLALACDEIFMPESGTLTLIGVRAEVTFYKELLDKLGIKADMLHMGEAKTAAEPFTRTSLSEASRKQLEGVLDDYYDNEIVGRIVRSRSAKKFTPEQVKKLIDRGPFSAQAALKAGLIDHLAYSGGVTVAAKKTLKADHIKVERDYAKPKREKIDFNSFFSIMKLLSPTKKTATKNPKIAVIYATGAIVTGKSRSTLFGADTCGSVTIIKAIRQAEEDNTVKAIVLRVDSPGGSALASDLMWHALVHCKKPVVASMSDVAASGGYYISMAAKKIYADPGTLTGSIGVVGGKIALGGLFDKVGVKTEILKRGANATIFSEETPFSKSERAAMTAVMQETYDQFVDKALAGRKKAGKKMTRAELLKIAGGRVWTGRQAKDKGLIDELGGLDDAIAAAKKLAGVPATREMELLQLPHQKDFLELLLEDALEARAPNVQAARLALLRQIPEMARLLAPVEALLQLRSEPAWLIQPYRLTVK